MRATALLHPPLLLRPQRRVSFRFSTRDGRTEGCARVGVKWRRIFFPFFFLHFLSKSVRARTTRRPPGIARRVGDETPVMTMASTSTSTARVVGTVRGESRRGKRRRFTDGLMDARPPSCQQLPKCSDGGLNHHVGLQDTFPAFFGQPQVLLTPECFVHCNHLSLTHLNQSNIC